jgi:hypothetical protein
MVWVAASGGAIGLSIISRAVPCYCQVMPSFTFTPTPEEDRFESRFKAIQTDVRAATTSHFIYLAIHNASDSELDIREKLRRSPEFWSTVMFSLQTTFFVSIGRLFDKRRDALSVESLLKTAIRAPAVFSRSALLRRKRFDCRIQGDDPDWLSDYISNAWEPTQADLESLLTALSPYSAQFKKIYAPIRHKIYAHRSQEDEPTVYKLFSHALISDVEELLRFLNTLIFTLQELILSGRKPDLSDDAEYSRYLMELRTEAKDLLRRLA